MDWEVDIPKMVLWTWYGNYDFLVSYIGLTNCRVAFMDLMNILLWKYLDMFVIIFIDDILVYSSFEDDHRNHLRILLQTLKDQQLFAKLSKCEFWLKLVALICHIVSRKGLQVYPKKTDIAKNWPRPLLQTDIKSFLGLADYYSRFV